MHIINYVIVGLIIYADEANNLLNEAQASGFVDTDLTTEAVWPNITKEKRSNRTKGEWSIKIKEEQVEKDGVMNDVGNDGDLVLMWHIWKEENDRWMAENHSLYLDFNSQNEFMTETAEQPSNLIIPLLRYQKEWLAWALKQEESIARGGILSDDMGMGKIIQPIALVFAKGKQFHILWINEIDRFNKKGTDIIIVCHGASREKNIGRLPCAKIVLMLKKKTTTDHRGMKVGQN
ncbi:hypothetical protein RDI58_013591 [Solanum bulbocastanum]|uniref:SNF2 N-terminal domain-containing protein n=1 Tax=Solanum bulbocastanum TaxID=147425 RepID=A0AAN8YFD2_SOLBU